MKNQKKFVSVIVLVCLLFPVSVQSRDIKDILSGLASKGTASDASGNTSGLGALGDLVSGLIATDDVEPEDMVGKWAYTAPAVCFKSENLLQKAGGAAAAAAVEGKLEQYYKAAGFQNMVLTINEDLTFSMTLKRGTLKGTVSKDENGNIIFNFTALGKIKLGTMIAYVTMTGKQSMDIMFDVSKLVTIIKTLGSVSGNATIKNVSALLESYDGICAGFKFGKQ